MAKDFFKSPKREDYRNEASYSSAVRKWRIRRQAWYIWNQLGLPERVYLLEEKSSVDPGENAPKPLDQIKLRQSTYRAIVAYPRTEHRRDIYRAKLKAGNRQQDVFVRKHEKLIRQPPKYALSTEESQALHEKYKKERRRR